MYVTHFLSKVRMLIHVLDDAQRTLVSLQGPPNALPEFSDDSSWYHYVSSLRIFFPR